MVEGLSCTLNHICSFHSSIRLNILVTELSLCFQFIVMAESPLMREKAGEAVRVFPPGIREGILSTPSH